jgi:multiple sugar transport system substrate-binding protein
MFKGFTASTLQGFDVRFLNKRTCGVLLLACLLALSGCGVKVPPTPQPVTLTFVYSGIEIDQSQYRVLIEKFNESYPHITIELRQWPPWQAMQNISGADVLVVYGGLVQQLQEQESIVSLEGFIQRDESFDLADLHPAAVSYLQHEGETFAVPAGIAVNAMFYNKDLLNAYGVPEPEFGWTWVDFTEKAILLSDPNAGVYGYASLGQGFDSIVEGFDVIEFIYQHGGQIVDDLYEPTDVTFDDPLTIEALQWYARLIHEEEAVLTPDRAMDLYSADAPLLGVVAGKVGMWRDDLSGTREVRKTINWGVVPLPRDEQAFTQAAVYGYAISAQAQDPEAAWQWITFLSNEVPPGMIPARTQVLESAEYEERVGRDVADVALASLEDAEIISSWSLFMEFRSEMQAFVRAIEKIQQGELSAEEAMDWAQDRATK